MKSKKATRNQTSNDKRAKPSDTSKTTKKTEKVITPTESAYFQIEEHLELLHPSFVNILQHQAKDYVRKYHALLEKERQVERMNNDPSLIPLSAKINFELKVSQTTKESEEFITLKNDTETIVSEFTQKLKDSIVSATKLEVNV